MASGKSWSAPWSEKGKMDYETPITSSQVAADDDHDYEKYGANRDSNPMPDLKRKLKSRHLQMIAIGELHAPSTPDLSR